MDLYILDDLLRRIDIVDKYESLIWTERWAAFGDFELVTRATWTNQTLLTKGTRLFTTSSEGRVMVIDTCSIKDDAEGRSMLTVTGKSLEYILEDRVARHSFADLTLAPRWAITGTPGAIVRSMFKAICIDGILHSKDVIPFIKTGTILPPDTIAESGSVVKREFEPQSLYKAIQDTCKEYDLGFALVRNADRSELYFEVYSGSDRTSNQHDIPSVVFSPELDNLTNMSSVSSKADYKNVAYVFSPNESLVVYGLGVDPSAEGFERRVLVVKVDNVRQNDNEDKLSITDILKRRGLEALQDHKTVTAFDGEIPKYGYQYKRDYRLGDIVEMRKADDVIKYMRVTEQIFISDAEGDRSYPTLAVEAF